MKMLHARVSEHFLNQIYNKESFVCMGLDELSVAPSMVLSVHIKVREI